MSLAAPARPLPPAPALYAPAAERLVGWLLGGFLLAQCFSLPLIRLGSYWSVWPTLPDLFLWAAGGLSLLYRRALPPTHRAVWVGLLALAGLALCAFGLLFVVRDPRMATAASVGLFQLYKLAQVLLVFWAVARLPLEADLLRRWRRAAEAAFWVAVLTIIWTTFSGALPQLLGTALPRGRPASGPWEAYYLYQDPGLGAIGYNHGYVALQVMLLAAAAVMLRPRGGNVLVLSAAIIACFLSESRAGLAGCLLFAGLEWRRTPARATVLALVAGALALALGPLLAPDLSETASRQSTLLEAGEGDNLSGRPDIWARYLEGLLTDPYRLGVGSGFGSAVNIGNNAHMQPLQVLYEAGVAGLTVYALFFWLLFRALRGAGQAGRVTLSLMAGLWFTALTQETFYPVPAFGGFLPLLACVVALALHGRALEAGEGGRG